MKIISLKTENFMNLEAVELKLDAKGVIITGENGAGKSNVLKAIITAFGGKKTMPKRPIMDGKQKAQIVVETEDIIITRNFTQKGDYLKITRTDEKRLSYDTPQTLLDQLVGSISFDPLAFAKMEAKAQRASLLDLMQIDLEPFDDKHAGIKAERSVVLAEGKRLGVTFEGMEFDETLPNEEVGSDTWAKKLTAAYEFNAGMDTVIDTFKVCQMAGKKIDVAIKDAEEVISKLTAELATKKKILAEAKVKQVETQKEAVLLEKEIDSTDRIDTDAILADIKDVETKNGNIRLNHLYSETSMAIETNKAESSKLLKAMKAVEDEKADALAESKMPVKGLSVDADGVIYNDLPLKDGINHAKQLEVCVAIGMAMNPKLNVMLLDVNGVGSAGLKAIQKMATDHEPPYQLLMEKMDESGEVGIYIKNGSVVTKETTAAVSGIKPSAQSARGDRAKEGKTVVTKETPPSEQSESGKEA